MKEREPVYIVWLVNGSGWTKELSWVSFSYMWVIYALFQSWYCAFVFFKYRRHNVRYRYKVINPQTSWMRDWSPNIYISLGCLHFDWRSLSKRNISSTRIPKCCMCHAHPLINGQVSQKDIWQRPGHSFVNSRATCPQDVIKYIQNISFLCDYVLLLVELYQGWPVELYQGWLVDEQYMSNTCVS